MRRGETHKSEERGARRGRRQREERVRQNCARQKQNKQVSKRREERVPAMSQLLPEERVKHDCTQLKERLKSAQRKRRLNGVQQHGRRWNGKVEVDGQRRRRRKPRDQ